MSSVKRDHIRLERAYGPPSAHEGTRVLVDRLWPRGLEKEKAKVDLWVKDLAPSTDLRRWYGHDPAKWPEFQRRYRDELAAHGEALDGLRHLADGGCVTLVYAARDEAHNNAVVLRDVLLER